MTRAKFLKRVLFFGLLVALVAGTALPAPAVFAWPDKDITFVVPFNPGGGFDVQARILAPFIEKYLPNKVNIIMKNVTGAGGKIGILELSRSKPDGYTIGTVGLEGVSFMRAMGELDIDIRNLSWLGQISSDPLMVAVPTAGKYKTPAEMKGQDIRFGVTAEMIPSAVVLGQGLGMKIRPVLFNGSGDAILALMRGDLDTITMSWPTMLKGIENSEGKLTGIFVTSKKRIPNAKDIPTLNELGIQLSSTAAAVVATSRVVCAPAGLDKTVLEALQTAMVKGMQDPEFMQKMKTAKQSIGYETGEYVKTNIASAVEAYTSIKDQIEPYLKKK